MRLSFGVGPTGGRAFCNPDHRSGLHRATLKSHPKQQRVLLDSAKLDYLLPDVAVRNSVAKRVSLSGLKPSARFNITSRAKGLTWRREAR